MSAIYLPVYAEFFLFKKRLTKQSNVITFLMASPFMEDGRLHKIHSCGFWRKGSPGVATHPWCPSAIQGHTHPDQSISSFLKILFIYF